MYFVVHPEVADHEGLLVRGSSPPNDSYLPGIDILTCKEENMFIEAAK